MKEAAPLGKRFRGALPGSGGGLGGGGLLGIETCLGLGDEFVDGLGSSTCGPDGRSRVRVDPIDCGHRD